MVKDNEASLDKLIDGGLHLKIRGAKMKGMQKTLKIGGFVKHKQNCDIIFQIVEILEPADNKNDTRMIVCNRVKDLYSYLESDLNKYTLTADDSENIINHNL